jgi:hypothetical protein
MFQALLLLNALISLIHYQRQEIGALGTPEAGDE